MKVLPPLLLTLSLFAGCLHAAERKPNFLFVYTDDQRWDAMGVVQKEMGEKGRYPWFQTPNMDRLATGGVRFRNAFVTLSLCSPSRAAFLTGRYNHLNGVANNSTPFPENSTTYASLLREAGYKTAYIGKWHMGSQKGQRPGFDYSASFIGQGKYMDCPFEINGKTTATSGWVDDVSTDYAIQFMKENRDAPFSLTVGFKSCHQPFAPPERAKDRFSGAEARPVPNMSTRAPFRVSTEGGTAGRAPTDADPKMKTNAGYFQCVSAADDCLGRLLDALDELGLADDTVVVFTSDNGYYHGEHGLLDKRSVYDESLRIPLIVRYPKQFEKGKVLDEMALNIDIAPMLLDLAGVPIPADMQGKSLAPLASGKMTDWRTSFLAEYFQENRFPTTPTMLAVRTDDAKLIKYPGHDEWTELFDLKADPYETKNLASDPSHKDLLAKMTAEFDAQTKAIDFRVPDYVDKPSDPASGRGAEKGGE